MQTTLLIALAAALLITAVRLPGPADVPGHGRTALAADTGRARILAAWEPADTLLTIQGAFTNTGTYAGALDYRLTVAREGAAGTSRTSQGGAFATRPARTDTLSRTSVNVRDGDRVAAHLVVRHDGALVAEARLDTTMAFAEGP